MQDFNPVLNCKLNHLFVSHLFYSDPAEQVWVWNYEGEKMFMDIEEPIRVRVLREQYTDTTPTSQPYGGKTSDEDLAANSTKIPPYSITVRNDSFVSRIQT